MITPLSIPCTHPQMSLLVGLPESSSGWVRSFPQQHHHHHHGCLRSYVTWSTNSRPIGGCGCETQISPHWHDQSVSQYNREMFSLTSCWICSRWKYWREHTVEDKSILSSTVLLSLISRRNFFISLIVLGHHCFCVIVDTVRITTSYLVAEILCILVLWNLAFKKIIHTHTHTHRQKQ
jgi:hypothetical protein